MNIHQKLVEVRKSIDGFTKDKQSYGYAYVSGSQVLSKIKEKMDELGILLYPSILTQEHEIFPYKDKYGKDKQDFLVFGDMTYKWINAEKPDDTVEIPWKYAGQQDDISKAYGSGLTFSERYFLLKFFGVPTDDDDPDHKQQNERNNPQQQNKGNQQQQQKTNQQQQNKGNQQQQQQQKQSKQQKPSDSPPDLITEGQVKAVQVNLNNLSKAINASKEKLITRLEKELGDFGSVSGMSKGQASKAITLLKKWLETTGQGGK